MPPRIDTALTRRMCEPYLSVAVVTCSASSRVGVSTSIFGWAGLKRGRSPRARADLRFLVRRSWPAGGCSADGEFVQGRQHEGRGLAGAGLRGDQQVAACDGGGNGLLLHGVGLV